MKFTQNLWHPAGGARQYEAAGSRTSFSKRWNPKTPNTLEQEESNSYALKLMIDVLTDDQKERWLYSFDTAA